METKKMLSREEIADLHLGTMSARVEYALECRKALLAHEDKQRDRIAELSATPTGEHWDAIIAAAANTPDAAKLINVITADYLRMRTERDEWAGIAGSNAGETELVKRNLEDAEGRYDACYAELTKTQTELAALRLRLEEAGKRQSQIAESCAEWIVHHYQVGIQHEIGKNNLRVAFGVIKQYIEKQFAIDAAIEAARETA